MVRLLLFHQNQKLGVELKDGVYRIGRDKPADIVVPDTTVSANHAELQVDGDSVMIRDLGSRNGTTVNGKPVKMARAIKPGDDVRVGAVKIAIEFPDEIKPLASVRAAPSGPTVRMEAVKVASSKAPFALKYWIAGAEAIFFLLALVLLMQLYTETVQKRVRLENRFKALAAQYVHVLSSLPTAGGIPAPAIDESLRAPVMVANREGRIIYPPPIVEKGVAQETPSPLIDSKTNKISQAARFGLADVRQPGARKDDGPLKSYPVSKGGETLGYVMARPAADQGSPLGKIAGMLVLSFVASLIVLYFTMNPVNHLIRTQLEALRVKISPLFNGFVDELPRSANIRELNGVIDEIEQSFAAFSSESARKAVGPGGRKAASEFAPFVGELLDAADVPYCFIDGDFNILSLSPSVTQVTELQRATVGGSLFDGGMTNLQSKELVQTITDTRKSGSGRLRLNFTRDGDAVPHDVVVRLFPEAGGKGQVYGIVFTKAESQA